MAMMEICIHQLMRLYGLEWLNKWITSLELDYFPMSALMVIVVCIQMALFSNSNSLSLQYHNYDPLMVTMQYLHKQENYRTQGTRMRIEMDYALVPTSKYIVCYQK